MGLFNLKVWIVFLALSASWVHAQGPAAGDSAPKVPAFKKVIWIWIENTPYAEMMAQKYAKYLWFQVGATRLSEVNDLSAVTQANAISMLTGNDYGIIDNEITRLFVPSLVDLLEAKGISWKVFAEDYPGSCNLNPGIGSYRRYRVPFLSFDSIIENRKLCNKIVGYDSYFKDVTQLPRLSIVIPGIKNSGSESGSFIADQHLSVLINPLLSSPNVLKETVVIISTIRSGASSSKGFHMIFGKNVDINGTTSVKNYSPYSILRTLELGFDLGHLNQNDLSAEPILEGWK